MKKEINGKEYELIPGLCEFCAFKNNDECTIPFKYVGICIDAENLDKVWKEVKDDSEN